MRSLLGAFCLLVIVTCVWWTVGGDNVPGQGGGVLGPNPDSASVFAADGEGLVIAREPVGAAIEQQRAVESPIGLVRVQLPDGTPADGAEVVRSGEGEDWTLGVTDAAGELQLDQVYDREELGAFLDGWVAPIGSGRNGDGDAVELVLQEASALRGIVTKPSGRQAGEGVWVLATPRGQAPNRTLCADPELRDPELWRIAATDSTGAFELHHLTPGVEYDLIAGGRGLVSGPQPVPAALGPGEASALIELPVEYAYGVVLKFQDSSGGAPVLSSQLRFGFGASIKKLEGVHGRLVPGIPASFLLAGFGRSGVTGLERGSQAVLATSHEELASLESVQVATRLPGYEPTVDVLSLPRLQGAPDEVVVEVGYPRDGFGGLKIHLEGGGESVSGPAVLRLFGHVRDTYLYDVELDSAKPIEVFEVPLGNYSLTLELGGGVEVVPDIPVEITIGTGLTECTLPMPRIGEVILEPTMLNGDDFEGPLLVSLCSKTNATFADGMITMNRSASHSLSNAPYRLGPLPAGSYVAQILTPTFRELGAFEFEIQPGASTSVSLNANR